MPAGQISALFLLFPEFCGHKCQMNISGCYNTSIVAVAEGGEKGRGQVSVYDLARRRRHIQFPVRFDPGARRLAVSKDTRICFVGCYEQGGIAAYSTADGTELWRREELTAVQYMAFLPSENAVFCGRNINLEGHVLCAESGSNLRICKGARSIFPSPLTSHLLASGIALEVYSAVGTRVGKIPRTNFADLDASFSDKELVITEAAGDLRCYDLDSLKLLWTHAPSQRSHFVRLGFHKVFDTFMAVWPGCEEGLDVLTLHHFERRTGRLLRKIFLQHTGPIEFCLSDTALFTSDFRMFNAGTGKLIYDFQSTSAEPPRAHSVSLQV